MVLHRIRLYPLPFAFTGGGFNTAYGQRSHLNNVLLEVETRDGDKGFGEICRMAGNTPEPLRPDRIDETVEALGLLIGADPANPAEIAARTQWKDSNLHNVRSAMETACLDLVARRAGLPLYGLLGGRAQPSIPTYFCISQGEPDEMAASISRECSNGYGVFQAKVGDADADADAARIQSMLAALPSRSTLLIDANGGWAPDGAVAVISRCQTPVQGQVFWEEPCRTYEENREVARRTGCPVILDQCVTGPELVSRACNEGLVAGLGIKSTMQGGVHRARLSRDICIAHGMRMKVDDSWAADVGTTASLHLALGVPPDLLVCGVDMRPYFEQRLVNGGAVLEESRFRPSDSPGLGITPDPARLPDPLATIQ